MDCEKCRRRPAFKDRTYVDNVGMLWLCQVCRDGVISQRFGPRSPARTGAPPAAPARMDLWTAREVERRCRQSRGS